MLSVRVVVALALFGACAEAPCNGFRCPVDGGSGGGVGGGFGGGVGGGSGGGAVGPCQGVASGIVVEAPASVDATVPFEAAAIACVNGQIDVARMGTADLSLMAGFFPATLRSVPSRSWVSGRAVFSGVVADGMGLGVELTVTAQGLQRGTKQLDVRRLATPTTQLQRLLIDQGSFETTPGPAPTAEVNTALFWAQADIVVLSHFVNGASFDPACGPAGTATIATAHAALPLLRRLSQARVFLYVAATVDAPVEQQCGNAVDAGVVTTTSSWACPGGACSKFIAWVNALSVYQPDGYFLDYFSIAPPGQDQGYKLGLATARNLVSYVGLTGKEIMVNALYSTEPNVRALLPAFDAWPVGAAKPRLLFEGFYLRDGAIDYSTLNGAALIADGGSQGLSSRFAMDFLPSEAGLQRDGGLPPFSCASQNAQTAISLVRSFARPGDSFQYSRSALWTAPFRSDPYCVVP